MTIRVSKRRSRSEITPEIEDDGLFKAAPTDLAVELTPRIRRNSRGDVVVMGFVDKRGAIDVVFAGRRRVQTKPLISTLQAVWNKAIAGLKEGEAPPALADVRIQARVLGAWRRRFEVDDSGWQTHEYQLLAARWSFATRDGTVQSFGEGPLNH